MKHYFLVVIAATLVFSACKQTSETSKNISFYDTQLFKDVQLAALYKDSKTFTDLVPKLPATELEALYLQEKNSPNFNLQDFVDANFMDKSMKSLVFETDTTNTMYEHIELMWDKLKRGPDTKIPNSSRIPLPHDYVVPGGRFQEIYYWDSYFTMEGLLADNRWELSKSMVDNFAYLLDSIGFIPNGTRDYFETRSQPPFFSVMVRALSRKNKSMPLYFGPQMAIEYEFFMNHDTIAKPFSADNHFVNLKDGKYLNRYFDKGITPRPEAYKEDKHLAEGLSDEAKIQLYSDLRSAAESGWDFSSRWFEEDDNFQSTITTSIVPVDLNCLLYHLEYMLSVAAIRRGDKDLGQSYRTRYVKRMETINEFLWNEEKGFYMDYNFKNKHPCNI